MPLRLLIILLLLLAVSLGAANNPNTPQTQHLPSDNITLEAADRTMLWHLAHLVRLCTREVDGLLEARVVPQPNLRIVAVTDPNDDLEYGRNELPLLVNAPTEAVAWRLLRRLIDRRCRMMVNGRRRAPEPATIAVVAAALTNRIIMDGKGMHGVYRQDFRIPRLQFAQGHFPQIKTLLSQPVPPESTLLFRIYLVHCDLLVYSLEKGTRDFPALLTKCWEGELLGMLRPEAALLAALGAAAMRTGENLQGWYERNALEFSGRGVRSNDFQAINEALQALMVVPVLDADASNGIRVIPLKQVPELLKDYRLDNRAISNIIQRLMRLKLDAPPLLHAPLDDFIAAVYAIRHGNNSEFQERYRQAEASLKAAGERQERIERLLDEASGPAASADQLRRAGWDAVIRHAEFLRAPLVKHLQVQP